MVDIDKAIIARYKTQGKTFEILVDCDSAIDMREGKDVDIRDVLAVQRIFDDARKGMFSSEKVLTDIFSSDDPLLIASEIIRKGEIQITAQHRARILEQKRKRILEYIHRNGVDPKTKLPHPVTRLELAFEEAKVRIDEYKGVQKQAEEIIKKLRPIIPISFERLRLAIKVPGDAAGRLYSTLAGFGTKVRDDWQSDGSWVCVLEIPAGVQGDLVDKLGDMTQGRAEVRILSEEQQ